MIGCPQTCIFCGATSNAVSVWTRGGPMSCLHRCCTDAKRADVMAEWEASTQYRSGGSLTDAQILSLYSALMSARRTNRRGWPKGKLRGPRDHSAPRCACGLFTASTAAKRGHKCSAPSDLS